MYYMNSAENQGFLVQFLALNILICYTWRFHWDVSWMLNHRKTQNCHTHFLSVIPKLSKFIKLVQISKLGFIFGLWGWASFLSVDWFTACSDSEKTSPTSTSTSPSSCKPDHICVCHQSLQIERVVIIISLPVPWVCLLCQHASMPEVCQACQRVIPEVSELPWTFSRSPRCPEGQVIVPLCQMAQNPQDCTYGANWFVMMILYVFLSHVMAYWLCVSPFFVL